jgi:phthalate 4,5-cis-dihydrodiol dehydrogenase
MTGAWDPQRPTEGAYSAFLAFSDGTAATAVYSGYAHFDSDELSGWVGELGMVKDARRYGEARRVLQALASPEQELALRTARAYGRDNTAASRRPDLAALWHQHFGTVLVSCEHADLRPLPNGVMIYGDESQWLEALPRPSVPRGEVIDELYDAIVNDRAPLHSGEWARATQEVCIAILTSAREQREIALAHQVAVPR